MLGFRRRRRARLRAAPFPAEWLRLVERRVRIWRRLPDADRRELLGHVQVLLAEKRFEGCGGLELTDEIRLTIAAQACLLLLHRDTDYYPRLSSVVVYPDAYVVKVREESAGGIVTEGRAVHLGESWDTGTVVLSWDDVRRDAEDVEDGFNVVLHEFAHQLDAENGRADGAPVLPRGRRRAWARVMEAEYQRLRRDDARGRETFLDPYGATDPAEFFAVITECFFEEPADLRAEHPQLYAELREFYRQDPERWPGERAAPGAGATGRRRPRA
jgi:hypothetical protein